MLCERFKASRKPGESFAKGPQRKDLFKCSRMRTDQQVQEEAGGKDKQGEGEIA